MTANIREDRKNQFEGDSWQNCLKINLLEQIMEGINLGVLKWTLWRELENHLDLDRVFKKWDHNISQADTESALEDLQQEGWIKVSKYSTNRFVITDEGREKVPENIFP